MNPLRIATHGLLGLSLALGALSAPVQAGARSLQASAMPMIRNVARSIVGPAMIPTHGIVAPDMVQARGIVAPDMVQAGPKAQVKRSRSRTRAGSGSPHGVVAPMFHLCSIVTPSMSPTRGIVAPDMIQSRGIVAPDMVQARKIVGPDMIRGIVAPDMVQARGIVAPDMVRSTSLVGPAMAPTAFRARHGLPQGFERPARRGDLSPYLANE